MNTVEAILLVLIGIGGTFIAFGAFLCLIWYMFKAMLTLIGWILED